MFQRSRRPFIAICLILFCLFELTPIVHADERIQKTGSPVIVVIDPGHGGDENMGTQENGFLEKEMNLTTAKAMAAELEKFEGIEVHLTRTGDIDLSLQKRAEIAKNLHADFLISLHYNASETHKLYGAECWVSLDPGYHNQGYQLGTMFLREFRDMGLTLRGIKTKRHSKGTDYYGIIRSAVSYKIPSIIVEHCHVDHPADNVFCDATEELEAFGRADARAVAKYFGLKSSILGVDYSEDAKTLPCVTPGTLVPRAAQDSTIPMFCKVSLKEADYAQDRVTVEVSAQDPDSNLIYYAYSFDGGKTFCDDLPWPEGDILTGEFSGKFEVTLDVPDGTSPKLCFRATNPYDLQNTSNVLTFDKKFEKPKVTEAPPEETLVDATAKLTEIVAEEENDPFDQIMLILQIAIVVMGSLFFFMLILFLLSRRRNKGHNSKEK